MALTWPNGQIVLAADIVAGKLTYSPRANVNGVAVATTSFQIIDNGGTDNGGANIDPTPKTLTFNLTPVNDSPSGFNKAIKLREDSPYVFATGDFGFSDANDLPTNSFLSVKLTTRPAAGTLKLNGVAVTSVQNVLTSDIAAGRLTYTPAQNASGNAAAAFIFQVVDNGGVANGGINVDLTPNTITFNITSVNDAPSGANKTITLDEDAVYTVTAADFGFSDIKDVPANGINAAIITTLPTKGSLTLNNVAVTLNQLIPIGRINLGQLKFGPAVNANGNAYASFNFQVQDKGGTSNGGVNLDPTPNKITFNVTAINDAPVSTGSTLNPIVVSQNSANTTAVSLGLSGLNYASGPISASDETVQTLTYAISAIPNFIRLFKANGTTSVAAGTLLTLTELRGLKYKTVANATGTGNVTLTISDNGSSLAPNVQTLTENLSITVNA